MLNILENLISYPTINQNKVNKAFNYIKKLYKIYLEMIK